MTRRVTTTVVAAAAVVVVLVAAVIVARDHRDGVKAARHIVQQDSRFGNGPKAGAAFAEISRVLLDDANDCAHHHGRTDARCQARSSAAAYTTVSAFALVSCTQPGVFRARQALLDELGAITTVDRRQGVAAPPAVPAVPAC